MKNSLLLVVITCLIVFSTRASSQSMDDLLRAVESGEITTVSGWLDKGLDVNTTDQRGNTILMLASRLGHRAMVTMLLGRKANVKRRSPAGDTALMMASLRGDIVTMNELVTAGAEVIHDGWTPLHYAAFEGSEEAVKFLLKKGAEKNAVAPNGYTALMLAARKGKADAAKTLLYEDPDVNFRTETGDTALKIARERRMGELVELLRRAGAVE